LLALPTPSSKFRNRKSEKEIPPISHTQLHTRKQKLREKSQKLRRNGGERPKSTTFPLWPCSVRQQTRSVGLKLTGALPCDLEYLATAPRNRTHTEQSANAREFPEPHERGSPTRSGEEREASPSVSRSVSRRWRRRSRRELTDAVAAACFSLSSATDAMGAARC